MASFEFDPVDKPTAVAPPTTEDLAPALQPHNPDTVIVAALNTWGTGLFHCRDDMGSLVEAMFCPYCQLSRQYETITTAQPELNPVTCLGAMGADATGASTMAFVKVVKNKAYFKRFQVKYRRRREGKTDYRARRKLVTQDKNKYNSPKYRFVVRITNTDVITQITYAKVKGDFVLSAAYAHELPRFGMPVGLTNYAAAYATGLLLARRLLTKLKLADKYKGNQDINGQDYNVEEIADAPRPFVALLDVGLRRTTTGSKVFAALKGATDGGLEIPHSERRFVGYDEEGKKLNAEVLKKYIFGGHVAEYMKKVNDEDPEKFKKVFSQYIKNGLKGEGLEAAWKKVHSAIRADPSFKKSTKGKPTGLKKKATKLNLAQRKNRVKQVIASQKAAAEKSE